MQLGAEVTRIGSLEDPTSFITCQPAECRIEERHCYEDPAEIEILNVS
jgi:hypothetical protein